jgi:hypothetical protein
MKRRKAMSKNYIIRFHLTAYEDYKVEADSPEDAYEMIKSGEYANYHEETDILYGSENKFYGLYEIGQDGKWSDELASFKARKGLVISRAKENLYLWRKEEEKSDE